MRDRRFGRIRPFVLAAVTGVAAAVAAQVAPLERFTVMSDGHPMAVWARRPASLVGAILLVHGRTWSSRPDFDLQVPGLNRSVMASLAARGHAAYAVDLRGYGGTPRDGTGWLTPQRSSADVANVLSWVAGRHPTLPRPALVGWSRGAAVSLLVAGRRPDLMSALVVFGFVYDPTLHYPAAATPAKPLMVKNTRADAMSDFVSPEVTPRAVVEAFVAQALGSDPVAVDLRNDHEMSAIEPARIAVPTLVLFGERDVNVPAADGAKFFARLGAADKQMVSLRGAGHAAQLEDTHEAWVAAVTNFMARPPAGR